VISRRDFDAVVATHLDASPETLRRIVESGRVLGLWELLDGGPRRGRLRVLQPKDPAERVAHGDEVEAGA
jgi:hypothetical protein